MRLPRKPPGKDDITQNYHGGALYSVQAEPEGHKKLKDRSKILAVLQDSQVHGLTCEELEDELEMAHQSCSARITELKRDGLIAEIGRRQNRSGRYAAVYIPQGGRKK